MRALDGMASQNFAAFLVSLGESVIAMPLILPFNVHVQGRATGDAGRHDDR